ncbi:MAG: leucine-rich repeat domain-containing protein, partial [Firmicutes bacterium]|nr:leucine-rich repeat domain-containing protein [Bacillota bacterium]
MRKRRIVGAVLAAVLAVGGVVPEFFGGGYCVTAYADETAYDFTYPVTGGNIYLSKMTKSMIDPRNYAFYDHEFAVVSACDKTVTVADIPSKISGLDVERIANSAFKNNTNLTSVTIPESIKIISMNAFDSCSSLADITIPDTVEAIDSSAFWGCTSLTSIDIPEGIDTVSLHCFYGCTMLQKVHLPSTIKKIEGAPFAQCNRLTEINIPEGVESIGMSAFMDCYNLGEVYIPESVKEIGYWAFNNCYGIHAHIPRTTLVIGEGAFNKAYKKPDPVLYVERGSVAYEYAVINGLPYVLTGEYKKPANTDDISITSVTMRYNGMKYNLLNTSPEIVEGDTDPAEIEVAVDWGNANPDDYYVYIRMGEYINKNSIGDFYEFCPGQDLAPSDVMGVGIFKKNPSSEEDALVKAEKLKLKIAKKYVPHPSSETTVTQEDETHMKIEFPIIDDLTVPTDNYPALGKDSFRVPIKMLEAEFELDKETGTFKATIGRNTRADDAKETYEKLEKFDNWKKAVKESVEDIKSGGKADNLYDTIEKRFKANGLDTQKSVKMPTPDFSAKGYIEGTIDENNNLTTLKGEIIAYAEMEFEYKGQTFIGVVPVVYGVGLKGSVKGTLGIDIKKLIDAKELRSAIYGSIVLTPEFNVTLGTGIVNVAELSAKGHAALPIEIHTHENYQKVSIKTWVDFRLIVGPFTVAQYSTDEIENKIYETAVAVPYSENNSMSLYSQINMNVPLAPTDRTYADKPSVWNESSINAYGSAANVLKTNIYPYAHPVLTKSGGKKILVWLADDANRDDYNRNVLMYSVYNESTGKWSTPLAVYDDGMLDMAFEVKNGYIVWQKANRKLTADDSLTDLAKSSEIWVAGFNGNHFESKRLTNDDEMDSQPSLDTFGTNVAVVWSKNTENDFFGATGKNSICMKELKGGSWQETEVVADGLNIIDSVSVGLADAKPIVAYSVDNDNKLDTVDDRELYLIKDGSAKQFTNNEVIDSKPVFEYLNGEKTMFWYSGDKIIYVSDFDDPVIGGIPVNVGGDEVSIASYGENAAVFYTKSDDKTAEVYVSLFDGTQWSEDIQLTSEGENAKYPSGLIDANGDIITAFNRTNNSTEQADLCIKSLTPECDIEAGRLFVGRIEHDSEIPVIFDIKNTGEKTVDSVKVELIDPEGNVNYSYDVKETILPGDSYEVNAVYTTGENIVPGELKAVISTESKERDTSNNTSSIETGLADVKTSNVSVNEKGGKYIVSADVTNRGFMDAEDVKAFISENED